jgi:type VI protein secretion system component VasF
MSGLGAVDPQLEHPLLVAAAALPQLLLMHRKRRRKRKRRKNRMTTWWVVLLGVFALEMLIALLGLWSLRLIYGVVLFIRIVFSSQCAVFLPYITRT